MKETLIQNRYISIPQTTGTNVVSINFKSEDTYKFLTGIACTLVGALPTADEILIELRDDFNTLLSFSPAALWLKDTSAASYDLQDVFKPLNVESKGKQFYLNIKVTNCSAFTFTALFRQQNTALEVATYDYQTQTITTPALGENVAITLPSNYSTCKGIAVTGGNTANAAKIALDINDAQGYVVDPLPFNVLTVSNATQNDVQFFPVDFESASKQIYVRLTALDSTITYNATTYNITFLLMK